MYLLATLLLELLFFLLLLHRFSSCAYLPERLLFMRAVPTRLTLARVCSAQPDAPDATTGLHEPASFYKVRRCAALS